LFPEGPEEEFAPPVLTLDQERRSAVPHRASALVFEDPKSRLLLERMRLVAPSEANVLVVGETGTGKELIASHLHALSARRSGPFIAVNCGAFSENLVESELFGHERGAFTGAISSKPGWFEVAHGGTLFLDEVGDLPLSLQVKLLRVLQEHQVVRLGSRKAITIDTRVVAATNVNLEIAVANGQFREDLYYRLNVAGLRLSPLRERRGDIPKLIAHFLQIYSKRLGVRSVTVGPEALQLLVEGHTWPGNIRELENVIHHAILVRRSDVIDPADLNLSSLRPRSLATVDVPKHIDPKQHFRSALHSLFEMGEENLFESIQGILMSEAYEYCHRNQLETGRLLGISRNIVRDRLQRCGALSGKRRSSPGITEKEWGTVPPASSTREIRDSANTNHLFA